MTFLDFYQNYVVLILYILLIAILVEFFFIKKKTITNQFKKIKKKTWAYLLAIFFLGFVIRMFVFPHFHMIYIDEPWNLEVAKNIANKNEPVVCRYVHPDSEDCFITPKPPGWSFLVSILYKIFGLSSAVAFNLNAFIGSFSIILIFILSHLIFKSEKVGLWASLFLSLTPIHVLWSNTAETMNSSVFFVLLTMISFVIYMKNQEKSVFMLTILLLIFSILVRFESIILLPILFLIYLKFIPSKKNKIVNFVNLFYPSLVLLALIAFVLLESLFIDFFRPFFHYNPLDYYYLNFFTLLKDVSSNFLYLPLALIGLFFKDNNDKDSKIYVILPLLFFFFLYLPIYTESRMALVTGIFVIMLSAFSFDKLLQVCKKYHISLKYTLIALLLIILGSNLVSTYETISEKYPRNLLETQSASEINDLIKEESCFLIAEFPAVITSSNIKGITTRNALNNPEIISNLIENQKCVYYFYDGYCIEWTLTPVTGSKKRCNQMLQNFELEEKASFGGGEIKYFLYKIVGTNESG